MQMSNKKGLLFLVPIQEKLDGNNGSARYQKHAFCWKCTQGNWLVKCLNL